MLCTFASSSYMLYFWVILIYLLGFPSASEVKASACNVGDLGLIPGLGRSHGEGNGNPLEYSCLGNPTDRGAWSCKESDTTEQLNHHHHLLDKSRYMNT